jgi:hypothetical protein
VALMRVMPSLQRRVEPPSLISCKRLTRLQAS